MNAIATDRLQRKSQTQEHTARGVSSVSSDLDQLLGPKNLAQLEKLERQVNAKLDSGEPVDTDYWEYLLKCLSTYKAHAKLRMVTAMIVQSRLDALRRQQATEAELWQAKLVARGFQPGKEVEHEKTSNGDWDDQRHSLDPEPMLRLRTEDKRLRSMTGEEYAREIAESRRKITKQGFVPNSKKERRSGGLEPASKRQRVEGDRAVAQGTSSLFDREVARGLGENEEFFTIEEPVATKNIVSWSSQYRPRKPKFFNRMQLGYEWNKYNQTHYDADNPPPKIVQGYKFNIFYPDLADKTRAPTYRIERENGRRRGQVAAPAGETDTCLIRFTAGPPYEDVAFRIVDREWDFSAKRERGFKSLFEKVSFRHSRVRRQLAWGLRRAFTMKSNADRFTRAYCSCTFNSRRYITASDMAPTKQHPRLPHETQHHM